MGIGDLTYLKLEDFDPPWRQAVVLAERTKSYRFVLAVGVTEAEIASDAGKNLSSFVCGGCHFLLVEGKASQLRDRCNQVLRGLEIPAEKVLTAGLVALEKDNLHYATASEEITPPKQDRPTSQLLEKPLGSSDESSEEDDDSGDDLMGLLKKAQKLKPGGGSGSEKMPRQKLTSRSRYPFLSAVPKESNPATTNVVEHLLEEASRGKAVDLNSQNLNALVTLELLKTLKSQKRSGASSSSNAHRDELSEGSSLESSDSQGKKGGASRALRAYRRGHRSMRRHPLRHVRRYIKEVEHFLGAGADTAYSLSDYTKKLNWGKNRSLLRVHSALSEILQTLLRDNPEEAALEIVQLLKAVHQTALDQGSWRTSWLLLRYADPVEVPRFGGEPQELERVAAYLSALQKLEKKSKGSGKGDPDAEDGKGSKKGKQKKKHENPEE